MNVAVMAAVLMMISYPIYRVVSLLIERSIDALEAVIYLGALTGFVVGIMTSWGIPLAWLLLVMLGVLCLGYQLIQHMVERRAMNIMDGEDLEECQELMERQPKNKWSYERAVNICRRRGEYERAIGYMEGYLRQVPDDKEMERRLRQLKRTVRQQSTGAKLCPECGTENYAGAGKCISCGRVLALPGDFLAGCATEAGLKALAGTAASLLVLSIGTKVAGAPVPLVGLLFVGAFVTSLAYLYLRS